MGHISGLNGNQHQTPRLVTKSEDHPILPQDIALSYYDEGAANIVYRLKVKPTSPLPSDLNSWGEGTPPPTEIEYSDEPHSSVFDDKLLRLRKDLPTTAPSLVAHESWERLIKPLFDSHEIVDQVLVEIPNEEIIKRLNDQLRGWESIHSRHIAPRPSKRQGTYLAHDDYGLLVTDMTPRTTGQELVEFKPKWLIQSPSAPKNSKRCRTCALTARSNAERVKAGEKARQTFCPLDLTSSSPDDILLATKLLLGPNPTHTTPARFSRWLQQTTLLRRLSRLQYDLDQKGVLKADIDDENFRVTMTLRDCTVFVRFPEDPETDECEIEARIGDLDLKSKDKQAYWQSTERGLIDEGWYQGSEKTEDSQPLTCSLSRQR